ncbi:YlbF family regulator [uncultured Pseudoramibacter sp.]|uniref:YlbF family regulator n=1 Tax=uncultured Pseudoramibacter sp. TaxID=1623493 RepID=UPI0025DD5FB8|nr:YlbF family regulator [uncultured Pseudoramibacter sp.]
MNIYDEIDEFTKKLENSPECMRFKAAQQKIDAVPEMKEKVEAYLREQAMTQARQAMGMPLSQEEIEKFNQKTRELLTIPEVAEFFQAQMAIMPVLKTLAERIAGAVGFDSSAFNGVLGNITGA